MNGNASVNDVSSDVALRERISHRLPALVRALSRRASLGAFFPRSSPALRLQLHTGLSEDVASEHVGLRGSDELDEPLGRLRCVRREEEAYRAPAAT